MPYRTRIKVCGITRWEDAAIAIDAGVDALGLVFYPPSPRSIAPAEAAVIARRVPAFVSVVALFVDAHQDHIRDVLQQVQPDLLQFHGAEPPAWCGGFERPYIKALRVRDGTDLTQLAGQYRGARALLLDSYREGIPGGTGQSFDWNLIPGPLRKRIVLAGGLNADNVGSAIATIRPYAVDVSGGVELRKGIKDATKLRLFVQQVRAADDSF